MYPSTILISEMCTAGRSTKNAGAIITPGSLIKLTSKNALVPHDRLYGSAQRLFAIEKPNQSVDVNYNIGEAVNYKLCRKGDQIYAFLVAGSSTEIGDYLGSAGDGSLIRLSSSPEGPPLAVALEQIEATMVTRILVEIM